MRCYTHSGTAQAPPNVNSTDLPELKLGTQAGGFSTSRIVPPHGKPNRLASSAPTPYSTASGRRWATP